MRVSRFRGKKLQYYIQTHILHPPDLADAEIEKRLSQKKKEVRPEEQDGLDPSPHQCVEPECEEKG